MTVGEDECYTTSAIISDSSSDSDGDDGGDDCETDDETEDDENQNCFLTVQSECHLSDSCDSEFDVEEQSSDDDSILNCLNKSAGETSEDEAEDYR